MYELLKDATTIGERIQRLMEDRKMALGDLHRQSGIAKGYLSELMHEDADSPPQAFGRDAVRGRHCAGRLSGRPARQDPPSRGNVSLATGPGRLRPAEQRPARGSRMLAGISARGRTPRTAEDWKAVHRIIEMYSQP